MRTLFWCCCAIVVTVASFVYLAVDYAREYPTSVIGRCVLLACRVGCEYNPAAMVARAVIHPGCPCQPASADRATGAGAADSAKVVDGSAEIEVTPADQEPCQIIDLSGLGAFGGVLECEQKNLDLGDLSREVLPPPAACDPRCSGGTPVMVPPDRIHDNGEEETNVVTPAETGTAPETMPAAREDAEKNSVGDDPFYEMWTGLFKGIIAETTAEPPMATEPAGSEEESEAVHDGAAPNLEDDPSCHEQYPGCPAMHGCPAPVTPPDATPRKHKKKVKATPPMTRTNPVPATTEPEVDEECPAHADVDTTEFRRTDAKNGEFSPHPF